MDLILFILGKTSIVAQIFKIFCLRADFRSKSVETLIKTTTS